jgi:hypothetical protein
MSSPSFALGKQSRAVGGITYAMLRLNRAVTRSLNAFENLVAI